MLEGAEVKKSVFIQNYVQVMRRYRPYMVQKEVSKHLYFFYSVFIYIYDDGFGVGGGNEEEKEEE